jgi:hypothetical protein
MYRARIIIYAALLAAAAVIIALQNRRISQLREENVRFIRILSPPVSSSQPAPNSDVATPPPQTTSPNAISTAQLAELERLRSESVTLASDIEKSRAEIAGLRSNLDASQVPFSLRMDHLPRNSWSNAGFASPEAALQTMLWAGREGDLNSLRASLTSGELSRRTGGDWKNKSDAQIAEELTQRLGKVEDFRILKWETLGADTMYFTVYVDGYDSADQPIWMDVQHVGSEWRVDSVEHHR